MRNYLTSYLAFNVWATQRLARNMQGIDPKKLSTVAFAPFGSIDDSLRHIHSAQANWMQRLLGNPWTDTALQTRQLDLDELLIITADSALDLLHFITAKPERAAEDCTFTTTAGEPFTMNVGDIALHVANHSTFHRGQIMSALRTIYDGQLESLDYITYCRELQGAAEIRSEVPADISAIASVTRMAFAADEHGKHNEHEIVNALRRQGALSVSLVAVMHNEVVGHVAFSPVTIGKEDFRWFGVGPVSVVPTHQGIGIGTALMKRGLYELTKMGAQGCVVLGSPTYYSRFGFERLPELTLDGVPQEFFMACVLGGDVPAGSVRYHDAFSI